jgi:hypothetical protein
MKFKIVLEKDEEAALLLRSCLFRAASPKAKQRRKLWRT